MKKVIMRKVSAILTAAILASVLLAGCGQAKATIEAGDAASIVADANESANYIPSVLNVAIPTADISELMYDSAMERIYALCGEWNEDYSQCSYTLYSFDDAGQNLNAVPIDIEKQNTTLGYCAMDTAGCLYGIMSNWQGDAVSADSTLKSSNYMVKIDQNGALVWKQPLDDRCGENGTYYANAMDIDYGDNLIISDIHGISVINPDDGTVLADIEVAKAGDPGDYSIYKLRDDKVYAAGIDAAAGTDTFYDIDMSESKLVKKADFALDPSDYTTYPGINYDLLLTAQDGVYGYNIDDGSMNKVMDYASMGLCDYALSGLTPVSPTQIIALAPDASTGSNILMNFLAPSVSENNGSGEGKQ